MLQDSWWLNDLEDDDEAGSRVQKVARAVAESGLLSATLSGGLYDLIFIVLPDITETMTCDTRIDDTNTDNEYALDPNLEDTALGSELLGEYFEAIVLGPDLSDSGVLDSNLESGDYYEVIHPESVSDTTSTLDANLEAGDYFLVVVSAPDQSETGVLDSNLESGNYFEAIIAAPDQSESGSLDADLVSGAYTAV